MRRYTGANLFGIAVGSSMGMILFSIAYHGSHVMFVADHIHVDIDNATFGFGDRFELKTGKIRRQIEGKAGDTLYFQNDTAMHTDNKEIARFLYNNIRILCFVVLGQNDGKLVESSRYLLGKRCNKLVYFSRFEKNNSSIIYIKQSLIGDKFLSVAAEAFRFIAQNHIRTADWFIRIDTLSYVILENLRYFLSSMQPSNPLYFGALSNNVYGKQGFCSAYVLSRNALEKFALALDMSVGKSSSQPDACLFPDEDERTGAFKCFQKLGVRSLDTTDNMRRSRFHCFHPIIEINRDYPLWFSKLNPHYRQNVSGVSDYAISFGNMEMNRQLGLEFYVYHLSAVGIEFAREDLNKRF